MAEVTTASKPVQKIIFATISAVGLLIALSASVQIHHLHRQLQDQQNTLNNLNTQINTLNANNTQLVNTLQETANAQTNLKQIQATSLNLALMNLQQNVTQGQGKNLLLNNFNSLQILANALHSNSINTQVTQLGQALNNLPSINPAAGISLLHTLQAELANLTFVNSLPTTNTTNTPTSSAHGLKENLLALWQQLKGLLIVRSDNAIGAQLVSNAARFDAVRQINLLLQEAEWQITTQQDPSTTLTQLKIAIMAYTQNDQNQAAYLTQLSQLTSSNSYYTTAEIQAVLNAINNLQQSLILQ